MSSNPFADPRTADALRLQSVADPQNPYAAPVNAELQERPEVIGVWRDGPLLVMHRRADLPLFCIVTGQPTTQRHWQTMRWSHPVDWGGRALIVEYGILPEVLRMERGIPWVPLIASAVVWTVILTACTMYASVNLWSEEAGNDLRAAGGVISAILTGLFFLPVIIRRRQTERLTLVNVEKHYVWLSGPSAAFLQLLPAWTEMGKSTEYKPR
jgi:hypothetical protein